MTRGKDQRPGPKGPGGPRGGSGRQGRDADGRPSWAKKPGPRRGPTRDGGHNSGWKDPGRPESSRGAAPGAPPAGAPGDEPAEGGPEADPSSRPRGRASGRMLYGINPLTEALAAGRKVHEAWALSSGSAAKSLIGQLRAKGVTVHSEDRHQLSQRCGSVQHQGIVARVDSLPNGSLSGLIKDRGDGPITVLVLDHLQDPQNLGAIYRSADAFGVDLIFIPSTEAASPQLASVAKASAGAVEHVATVVVGDLARPLEELKGHQFVVIGLEMKGASMLPDYERPQRLCLVAGNEGTGITHKVRPFLDGSLAIPMKGKVNSLNVASSVATVLYSLRGT